MRSKLLACERVEPAVTDDGGFYFDGAKAHSGVANLAFLISLKNADIGDGSGLGVFAAVVWLNDCDVISEIEFGDAPGGSLMQIDGTRVDEAKCACAVDGADQ